MHEKSSLEILYQTFMLWLFPLWFVVSVFVFFFLVFSIELLTASLYLSLHFIRACLLYGLNLFVCTVNFIFLFMHSLCSSVLYNSTHDFEFKRWIAGGFSFWQRYLSPVFQCFINFPCLASLMLSWGNLLVVACHWFKSCNVFVFTSIFRWLTCVVCFHCSWEGWTWTRACCQNPHLSIVLKFYCMQHG